MVKKLPSVKKSLKSFILDEDAKVMDKTALKIAITSSFFALNFLSNVDDANAKGHKNHTNHANHLMTKSQEELLQNNMESGEREIDFSQGDEDVVVKEIMPKTVNAVHGNHYNHVDGGKKD